MTRIRKKPDEKARRNTGSTNAKAVGKAEARQRRPKSIAQSLPLPLPQQNETPKIPVKSQPNLSKKTLTEIRKKIPHKKQKIPKKAPHNWQKSPP